MDKEKKKGKSMKKNTCDILLCSGNGRVSKSIKRVQRLMGAKEEAADISHVALFMRSIFLQYAFEATKENKWAKKKGVQINAFHKWKMFYNGRIYIRHLELKKEISFEVVRMAIEPYLAQKDYESGLPGMLELMLTFFPWINLKQTPELHCTEVDIEVLQDLNLYNKDIKPNKMPPCEFWPGGRFEKHLFCSISGAERIK